MDNAVPTNQETSKSCPPLNCPVLIELSEQEVLHAISIGGKRQWEALKKGLADKHGFEGDGWEVHIEGAMGELAVAKALNIYWDAGVNTFKTPDLGPLYIRTRSQHHYDLLIREDDDNEAPWILATGRAGKYHIHGWIRGKDAKKPMWSRTHGNRPRAYFVPKSALSPLLSLKLPASTPSPHPLPRWKKYEPLLTELSAEIQPRIPLSSVPFEPSTQNWPLLCFQLAWLATDSTPVTTPEQKALCAFLLKELRKCLEQTTEPTQKKPLPVLK